MTDGDSLDLATRSGLPDALRILLADYPRTGWTGHRNFDGLVRFWLDRHLMFRKLMATLTADSKEMLDGNMGSRAFGSRVARFYGILVKELHGHHQIEDIHYFPPLSQAESRIARGFEILDHDQHAIDGHLTAFVEDANKVLKTIGAGDAPGIRTDAGRFLDRMVRLDGFLDRHLIDEEELVVPVILKHGPGLVGH